jgi:hypothetical protein
MSVDRSTARIYRPTKTRGRGTRNRSHWLERPEHTRTAHSRAPAHTQQSQSVSRQSTTFDLADRNDEETAISTDFGRSPNRLGVPQVSENASTDRPTPAAYVCLKSMQTDVSLPCKSHRQNDQNVDRHDGRPRRVACSERPILCCFGH